MRTKTQWILGLLVLVAGTVAWRVLRPRGNGERVPDSLEAPVPASGEGENPSTEIELPTLRKPELEPSDPPPETIEDPIPSSSAGTRSAPAQHLDEVAASFLTERLRVVELLGLVQDLADRAVVVPESLQIERDEEGAFRFARGELLAGDLRGTFLVEEARYSIEFRGAVDEDSWSGCSLHIVFDERESAVLGGHATVQFHPQPDERPAGLAPHQEKIVGWTVDVSRGTGARATPITVRAMGDAWDAGDGASVPLQEFPWISDTSGFESWLRLLQAYGR